MKKKKGFTLIELLGVLILLAVIALITFPIIDKVLSNAKNEAYERQKDSIIEAARMYVTTNGNYNTNKTQLSFQTLIDAGFLKEGEILDPRDSSKEMPGCVIYNWNESKNQYIFEYSEDCIVSTSAECFTYKDTTLIDSFNINYDECITYMTNIKMPEDMIAPICSGESADGLTLKSAIEEQILDINELKFNNVITNIVETKGIEITGYDNKCGGMDVVLPNSIDGKDIISIGEAAFGTILAYNENNSNLSFISNKIENFEINSIDMSNSIKLKNIGNSAFSMNQLTSVIISNSVKKIGNEAFYGNQLTSVTIPNSVTTIESSAFAYNRLTNVIIGKDVTEIGRDAFYKYSSSNLNLTTIVNQTGKAFDWGYIINGLTGYNFETGTVVNGDGNVEIIK